MTTLIGATITLIIASSIVTILAAVGLFRLRHRHAFGLAAACQQLERDLIMAIGMIFVLWTMTAVALLINPSLGRDFLIVPGGYSMSRGSILLAFGQCVGWGAFCLRRAIATERYGTQLERDLDTV